MIVIWEDDVGISGEDSEVKGNAVYESLAALYPKRNQTLPEPKTVLSPTASLGQ